MHQKEPDQLHEPADPEQQLALWTHITTLHTASGKRLLLKCAHISYS